MTETFYQERNKLIREKYVELREICPGVKLKAIKEKLADEFCMSVAQMEKVLYKKEKVQNVK